MKKLLFGAFVILSQIGFNQNLQLLSGDFTLNKNIESISEKELMTLPVFENSLIAIIDFNKVPNIIEKKLLAEKGIRLLKYLPEKAFFATIDPSINLNDIKSFSSINGIHEIKPQYKLHPKLTLGKYPDWIKKGDHFLVVATIFEALSFETATQLLIQKGYTITELKKESEFVYLKVNEKQLYKLLEFPFIQFIEPISPPSYPENNTAVTLNRSNYLNSPSDNGLKYDGTGVNVMMQDDGIIGEHIDYQGRLDQSHITSNSGDHGDHVAGTIMGAGNLNPLGKGMANGAFLYVFGSSDNNYSSVPNLYQNQNLVITSKSYSNGCNAGYTTLSRDLDEQIDNYPSLIHVFSAGNSGTSDCGYGAGSNWGNITGGHKVGKNVITVGNLNEEDVIANSSSRGPAEDGRIKPDVCAKGTNVFSTVDVNDYAYKTGTSMSCPGVSGSLAQLYHAYKDLNNGQNPRSSLIKAALMNSAEDLGNPGPDFIYGWGRVNLKRSYETLLNQQYFYDSLDNGNNTTITLNVPAGQGQLRVMLYWSDIEGTANAAIALVNDLDMTITTPSGNVVDPWILNSAANANSLNANATRGNDHLNNVEQITIDNPSSGNYTISIDGFNVPSGPQDFYVVYEFRNDDVILTYPNGGDPFVPGETEKIRWDAFENTGNFSLEYSLDSGATWSNISTNINSSLRFYDWTVPTTVTGNALIRVARSGSSDISDECFSIIGVPTNITSLQSCAGSLIISWDPVTGADGYTVFVLGNKYMDSVGVSNSNQFTYAATPNTTYWISVNATGPTGAYGRRAIAVQLQSGNSSSSTTSDFGANTNGTCDSILTVNFNNTSVNGVTYYWDFGDGNISSTVNPTHTYASPGVYNVMLIADGGSCGIDTLIENNFIAVGQLAEPDVDNVSICSPQSVSLSALSSNVINWYDQLVGGNSIHTGNTFTTPLINNSTTYYVEASSAGGINNVGPADNSFGNGGYFTNGGRHLVFDAFSDLTLNSVWVDADGAGNRTIELRNSNGVVIKDTTINIPDGQGRITLNFNISPGTDYQLGVTASSDPSLYRNNSNVNYPYSIANLISIKQSNANTPGAYYYFFYDWEIETSSCLSDRKEVTISLAQPPSTINDSICGSGTVVLSANGTGNGTLNWYDNANGGILLASGNTFTTPVINTTTSYYVEEEVPSPPVNGGPSDNTFGTGAYFNGDQHLLFDCFTNSILKSVKLYAGASGNRTIELRDNNGTVLQDITLFLPAGESRAVLNFNLNPGNDYQLGVTNGSSPDLYRNNNGPNYPYNINGLVEITNSSAGVSGSPGYYYFFYDWELAEPPCFTSRTMATAIINNTTTVTINPISPICINDAPVNLTASLAGGTWAGNGITNISNGTFDPMNAGAGTHLITYTTPGTCSGTDSVSIDVFSTADPTINGVNPLCVTDNPVSLTAATSGGSWAGNGVTNGTFDPAIAGVGTHSISYTISGNCGATDQIDIVVNSIVSATINAVSNVCEADPSFNLSAASPGGVWSGNGITDPNTGTFDPSAASAGSHTISYTINGNCGDSDQTIVIVDPQADPTINPINQACISAQPFNLSAASPGGIWSGTGITDPNNGTFDPSIAGIGTHVISYSISGNCGATDQTSIVVSTSLSPTINTVNPICTSEPPVVLSADLTGGTWSGNGITNTNLGTFNPATAGPGTHTITYSIPGACGGSDQINIIVNNNTSASINPAGPYCLNDPVVNLIAANNGGVWSGNGITNAQTGEFNPSIAGSGTHVITYVILGVCGDIQTTTITINNGDASFILPIDSMCTDNNSINIFSSQAGGTWSGIGIVDPIQGIFDPFSAGPGNHLITYSIAPPCPDSQSQTIVVEESINAFISPVSPLCYSASSVPLIGIPGGGTWSGNGITNAQNGIFDPSLAGVGSHTINYEVTGNCGDVTSSIIIVDDCSNITNHNAATFEYFPNPAKDKINLNFYLLNDKNLVSIHLHSVAGKTILVKDFQLQKGENQIEIEIPQSVSNGLYFIETSGDYNSINPIIIMK